SKRWRATEETKSKRSRNQPWIGDGGAKKSPSRCASTLTWSEPPLSAFSRPWTRYERSSKRKSASSSLTISGAAIGAAVTTAAALAEASGSRSRSRVALDASSEAASSCANRSTQLAGEDSEAVSRALALGSVFSAAEIPSLAAPLSASFGVEGGSVLGA